MDEIPEDMVRDPAQDIQLSDNILEDILGSIQVSEEQHQLLHDFHQDNFHVSNKTHKIRNSEHI